MIRLKNEKGFTLVEMMVSVAIALLLSAVLLLNYRAIVKDRFALQAAVYKLAQDIRMMQAIAGAEEINCKKFGAGNSEFHIDYKYGYGVYLETASPSKYKLFADCDGTNEYAGSNDETLYTFEFEEGIEINQLLIDGSGKDKLSLVFTPPDPAVFFKDGVWGSEDIKIILENRKGEQRSVKLNKIGLIDID